MKGFLSRLRANARKRDVVILGLACTAILATSVWMLSVVGRVQVQLVNGLDLPVTVAVAGQTVSLGPRSRASRSLPVGVHSVTTRLGERPIEETLIEARRGADAVVYNVLGAAPIIVYPAIYKSSTASGADAPKPTPRAGRSFFIDDPVDYLFTEPPKSISSEQHSGSIVKHVMELLDGGWQASASVLMALDSAAAAAELMTHVASVQSESLKAMGYATTLRTNVYGQGSSIGLLREVVTADGTNDYAARALMFEGCRVGGCELGQTLLSALPAEAPTAEKKALLGALRGVELAGSVSLDAWKIAVDDALRTHGDDPRVLRWAGGLALRQGDYPACVRHFERLLSTPSNGNFFVDFSEYGRCLVLLDRTAEAKAAAKKHADPEANLWNANEFYVRACLLEKAQSPEDPALFDWMSRTKGEAGAERAQAEAAERTRLRLVAARPVEADRGTAGKPPSSAPTAKPRSPLQDAVQVGAAALKSPEAAALACEDAASLEGLPEILRVLLGAEFLRTGKSALGRRLLSDSGELRLRWNEVLAYVRSGTEALGFPRLDPEERAALDVVRAREQDARGIASAPLYARAAAQDPLKGWVTRAALAWERPTRPGAAASPQRRIENPTKGVATGSSP